MGNQAVLGPGRTQGPEDFKEAGICTRVPDQGVTRYTECKSSPDSPPTLNPHLCNVTLQHISRVEPISFPLGAGLALSLTLTTDCSGRDGVPVLSLQGVFYAFAYSLGPLPLPFE